MKIIDGEALANKIKDEIVKDVEKYCQATKINGQRPNLAIILIGKREDSCLYVDLKEKEAKKVGIDTHLYRCPENITEGEVLDMIEHLNKDSLIDAILVQLPLPKGFDTDGIIRAIDPIKDVDRFHPNNLEELFRTCNHTHVMPPVFEVILEILKSINYNIRDKKVIIVVNSDIFGKSLAKVLGCRGARTVMIHGDDKNLKSKTQEADVLITAVGKPGFIKGDMIKKGVVIIDIGITKKGKKVYGDVDFEDIKDKAGYITPVPGGVGPMTIAMAFKNTVELYKRRHGIK
jgi:methylenetetrahydrofolate dehydrogenase (NADP+)/methenyltetrahydrofolate cyclohydrolase